MRLQVWSAICASLLVAIARKEPGLPQTLPQILRVVSLSLFEQAPLPDLLNPPARTTTPTNQPLLMP